MKKHIKTDYDLENRILYDLCRKHPLHKRSDEILAKTLLIGRTYAASLDRGKNRNSSATESGAALINDDFYQDLVVPIFKKSSLDKQLAELKTIRRPSSHLERILQVHNYLTEQLKLINTQSKRSFSSKYLHFHLPRLFFLFDSRAHNAIQSIVKTENVPIITIDGTDPVYARFYQQAFYLQDKLSKKHGLTITPRQLDNFLLFTANNELRNKLNT